MAVHCIKNRGCGRCTGVTAGAPLSSPPPTLEPTPRLPATVPSLAPASLDGAGCSGFPPAKSASECVPKFVNPAHCVDHRWVALRSQHGSQRHTRLWIQPILVVVTTPQVIGEMAVALVNCKRSRRSRRYGCRHVLPRGAANRQKHRQAACHRGPQPGTPRPNLLT